MAFITTIEFIVLLGSGVDAQRTIPAAFGLIFLGELVFCKRFWVVLLCICGNGCGNQADEGRIYNAQRVKLAYQPGRVI